MAEQEGANGAGEAAANGSDNLPQVGIIAQYVKDSSFENPNAPAVFQWQSQPQMDVQFNIGSQLVGQDIHEVALKIDISAKAEEGTAFQLELLYGGLFAITNVPEDQLQAFLFAEAPRLLFPFARKIVDDLIMEGGFPPLRLQPIDFAGLYLQRAAQDQAAGSGGEAGDAPGEAYDPAGKSEGGLGMNLIKAIGTIGGLTMVSRVLGFARDMIGSRVLGASHQNDAFLIAFQIPNIFRRLFGEGAFASGFVPLFSQRLNSEGGIVDAQKFSNEVLAVFMPSLILVTLAFEIIMPGFVWLMASEYQDTPGKFELTVLLTRITFPYLILISLVSLLSGVLNSLTRFAVAAFVPALLNFALIVALLLRPEGGAETVTWMALAVVIGGILQLAMCWSSVRKAGVHLHFFQRPRMTPAVRELLILVLPATFAAGVYQISQLFYVFFASRLGEGAMAFLNYADRLNQLPLSIIGTALGTAILPSISRAIDRGAPTEAAEMQGRAFELSMLLTLPATLALAVASGPIISALFEGGRFTADDARITGNVLAILVIGLPGYVLIKVLTPGFYARKDVRTPVRIAMAILAASVVSNFVLIQFLGIYALATTTAVGAWINFLLLYFILARRGHFSVDRRLASRLVRQLVAAVAMATVLYFLRGPLEPLFMGDSVEPFIGVAVLVGTGMIVYFALAWMIGGMSREDFQDLLKRKRAR